MKNLSFALPLILMFLLNSCVTTQTYTREEKKMKIDNEGVLVVKKDGKSIYGKTLKFVYKSSSIKIDDQEFKTSDLFAFQDKTAYFAKFGTDKKYIWAKQLKRGKINLYYFDAPSYYTSNGKTNITHFLFNKGSEKLLELSITEIAELLRDNKMAYNKFTTTFGEKDRILLPKQLQNHPKVIFEAIDIYNGDM